LEEGLGMERMERVRQRKGKGGGEEGEGKGCPQIFHQHDAPWSFVIG